MPEISLNDILEAREARAARRIRMQTEHPGVCVALSINIPGPEKDSPRIRELFLHAVHRVHAALEVSAVASVLEVAGPHAVFAVTGDPLSIKETACRLESETGYGRLLDLDVYDASGAAVSSPSRGPGRACFVCTELAIVCMRENRHTPQEVATAVNRLFAAFHAEASRSISAPASRYAALGLEAMLYEVASCPSPGLVDPLHTGSHKDMDFFTFQRSSAALAFALARCAEAGIRHRGEPMGLLPVLRLIGLEAEDVMLRATGGVNTQKGLLFSLGLTLGATGLLVRNKLDPTPERLCETLRLMTAGMVARELGRAVPKTAGEKMYRDFGISGIRGEMEAGLPSVLTAGLPTLENALARGEACNRALLRSLVALMAVVDDTTILARSPHPETLRKVQAKARAIHDSALLDRDDWQNVLWEMDAELVRQNLSPGGSADLLALTWFMHRVRTLPATKQDR